MYHRSQWFACQGPCERLNVTLSDYSQSADVSVRVSGLCLMCGSGAEYIGGLASDQERLNQKYAPPYYAGEKLLRHALKKDGFHKRCPGLYAAVTGLWAQRNRSKRRPAFRKDVREYDRPSRCNRDGSDEDGGGDGCDDYEYSAAHEEYDEQEPYVGEIPEFMTDAIPAEDDTEALVEEKPDQDIDSLSESGEQCDINGNVSAVSSSVNGVVGSVCCFCNMPCPRGDNACSRCMTNFTL